MTKKKEINSKKISVKSPNSLKLNNTLANNQASRKGPKGRVGSILN